jgi:malonyl-CoA O-methyltransferase
MSGEQFLLDTQATRRSFDRAAASYDQAAALQREVAKRMVERLQYVKLKPLRIIDVGCGTGADLNLLGERYQEAQRVGVDLSLPMLRTSADRGVWFKRLLPGFARGRSQLVCANAQDLPLRSGCAALLWSNLVLHWLNDPLAAFGEFHRVLDVGGLLMFTTLGPDTLRELRQAFAAADTSPHVHRFIDMHDIGDMLVAAGFGDPVMDMEVLTLTYVSLDDLMQDLRGSGARNAALQRRRGLMGKRAWHRTIVAYESARKDGRLPATIEVVYGHAWKPAPRFVADGRAIVRLDPQGKRRK